MFKIVLLVNSWILANGIPLAMLQYPTSSQSIIFHPIQQNTPEKLTSTQRDSHTHSSKQPKYEYKYEVSDHQTGDRKSHWETRNGDVVNGAYSLYEPDGSLRTVEYSADSHHGYKLLKSKEFHAHSSSNLKIIALSAILAISAAGIVPVDHYSPAAAVSSQSIVRHDEGQRLAKVAVAAPVAYHAAPVAYHSAPVAYQTAPVYNAAPAHYSAANAVSSQTILHHDQPQAHGILAAPVHYAAPVAKVLAPAHKIVVSGHHEDEYINTHPKYDFSYSVADGHTGDNKSQHESRDGDIVHGEYSLVEADVFKFCFIFIPRNSEANSKSFILNSLCKINLRSLTIL
ncbi:hypothetical protein K1T71_004385 [Dendrolimus kikuchii]|uniref:Uncharacterized protein n=1 Tax=Dendrolimus kikuchii TaxID=765133 RepID=A0ACC1D757_9NEOP|nr:hypothetical protein K1T71_004385 [Dendrolimus kikuchii]